MSLGLRALLSLTRIDAMRSMKAAVDSRVTSPHLRQLLYRYATYNGSDVRRAPATLNCIAHVELAMGGFGIEGGIYAVVEALTAAAVDLGVEIRTGAPVDRIRLSGGRVTGVVLRGGAEHDAEVVVANADPALVMAGLLPAGTRHGMTAPEGSMSGWNGVLRARRRTGAAARAPHRLVLRGLHAGVRGHLRPRPAAAGADGLPLRGGGLPRRARLGGGGAGVRDGQRPARAAQRPSPPGGVGRLEAAVLRRLDEGGLRAPGDALVWRRTPTELAARFPGSRGSIYGGASNDMFAAFRRPPNRVSAVPGLYMASGGAHPGGGMPLAMLSGQAAARLVAEDAGLPTPSTAARGA